MSVCGTCCILGKVQTLQVGEEPKRALGYFMGIGNLGQAVCIASLPFKFCEPLGGCVWFMLNAFRLRKQVADKYNLRHWTPCCLGAGVELPMGVAGKLN